MAARETQVVDDGLPVTTVDQVGTLASIVQWVNQSLKRLELSRPRWRWMIVEFTSTASTTIGVASYTAAALGITSFSRWQKEMELPDGTVYRPISIYLAATGVSDENELQFMDWETFRITYRRGTQTNNRPLVWTVNPATQELVLGPAPNAAFKLKGEVVRAPQVLSGDSDTPTMPADHHELIAWMAVAMAQKADEATTAAIETANEKVREFSRILDREQYAPYTLGGDPIA